jgi:hypothetical protein
MHMSFDYDWVLTGAWLLLFGWNWYKHRNLEARLDEAFGCINEELDDLFELIEPPQSVIVVQGQDPFPLDDSEDTAFDNSEEY